MRVMKLINLSMMLVILLAIVWSMMSSFVAKDSTEVRLQTLEYKVSNLERKLDLLNKRDSLTNEQFANLQEQIKLVHKIAVMQ